MSKKITLQANSQKQKITHSTKVPTMLVINPKLKKSKVDYTDDMHLWMWLFHRLHLWIRPSNTEGAKWRYKWVSFEGIILNHYNKFFRKYVGSDNDTYPFTIFTRKDLKYDLYFTIDPQVTGSKIKDNDPHIIKNVALQTKKPNRDLKFPYISQHDVHYPDKGIKMTDFYSGGIHLIQIDEKHLPKFDTKNLELYQKVIAIELKGIDKTLIELIKKKYLTEKAYKQFLHKIDDNLENMILKYHHKESNDQDDYTGKPYYKMNKEEREEYDRQNKQIIKDTVKRFNDRYMIKSRKNTPAFANYFRFQHFFVKVFDEKYVIELEKKKDYKKTLEAYSLSRSTEPKYEFLKDFAAQMDYIFEYMLRDKDLRKIQNKENIADQIKCANYLDKAKKILKKYLQNNGYKKEEITFICNRLYMTNSLTKELTMTYALSSAAKMELNFANKLTLRETQSKLNKSKIKFKKNSFFSTMNIYFETGNDSFSSNTFPAHIYYQLRNWFLSLRKFEFDLIKKTRDIEIIGFSSQIGTDDVNKQLRYDRTVKVYNLLKVVMKELGVKFYGPMTDIPAETVEMKIMDDVNVKLFPPSSLDGFQVYGAVEVLGNYETKRTGSDVDKKQDRICVIKFNREGDKTEENKSVIRSYASSNSAAIFHDLYEINSFYNNRFCGLYYICPGKFKPN